MSAPESLHLVPHSIDAEQSVLGGLMLDGTAFDRDRRQRVRILTLPRRASLHLPAHRPPVLGRQAGRCGDGCRGTGERWRGRTDRRSAYLGELAAEHLSAANIRRYAEIVREKASLRRIQEAAMNLHSACSNISGRNLDEIIAEAEIALLAAVDRSDGDPKPLFDVFMRWSAVSTNAAARTVAQWPGWQTGFGDLDRLTGGLEPGQLVTLQRVRPVEKPCSPATSLTM